MVNPIDELLGQTRGNSATPQNGSKTNEETARELIAQAGGDGKKAFFDLCKARGLDPMSIISQYVGGR